MLALINDVLDVSKIEAGALQLEYVPTSPRKVVAEVLETLFSKAAVRGLKLAMAVADDVPAVVLTRSNSAATGSAQLGGKCNQVYA